MSSPTPWQDARSRIESAALGVPIQWPNEPFVVPNNPKAMWLDVSMTGDTLEPIELGPARAWREDGALYVQIYTPAGAGSLAARTLGKQIVNLFRDLPDAVVTYHRASVGDGQVSDVDGSWWRYTVTVEYRYDDIVS